MHNYLHNCVVTTAHYSLLFCDHIIIAIITIIIITVLL